MKRKNTLFAFALAGAMVFGGANAGVHPLTGELSESVPMGMAVGGMPLMAHYSTIPKLGNFKVLKLPSMGKLWNTTYHRSLAIVSSSSLGFIKAYRGDGHSVPFTWVNGVITPGAGAVIADSLTYTGGYYYYTVGATGDVEKYSNVGVLLSISRKSGRVLNFAYSSGASAVAPDAGYLILVSDDTGRFVQFQYQPGGTTGDNGVPMTASEVVRKTKTTGLLSKVIDSSGAVVTVNYDATLTNVQSFNWSSGAARYFVYENASTPWAMTGEIDESGSRLVTWQYGDNGLATGMVDAAGGTSSVSYSTPPSVSSTDTLHPSQNILFRRWYVQPPVGTTVTTANGAVSSWSATSVNGGDVSVGLSGSTQASGSGCAESNNQSVFDANGNLTQQDDFDGHRSCYAYDSRNNPTVTVLGLGTNDSCASMLQDSALLPTGATKTKTSWHATVNVPVTISRPGTLVTNVYHGQPDPFNNNTPANCTTAPAMSNGQVLPLVCKTVTQATLDAITGPGAPSVDQYYPQDSLLLHGDGTNGAATIVDSGPVNRTIASRGGNVRLSTAKSMYGGSAIYFDGAGSYISYADSADFAVTSGASTIEAWVNLDALPATNQRISGQGTNLGGNAVNILGFNAGSSKVVAGGYNGSAYMSVTSATALTPGVWYHVAYVTDATNMYIYINGVLEATASKNGATFLDSPEVLSIGRQGAYDGFYFKGYIDDFRFTKGVARYTANFTPPGRPLGGSALDSSIPISVAQFTYDAQGRMLSTTDSLGRQTSTAYYSDRTFGSSSDANYVSVSMLLHGDGANGAKIFTDSSLLGTSPTLVSGNVVTSTASSKWGGASIYFDGQTSSYIDYPSSPIQASGDLTIEGWLQTSSASYGAVFDNWTAGVPGSTLMYAQGNAIGWYYDQNNPIWANNLSLGQWTHFALVKSGNTCTIYVGGNVANSVTCTTPVGVPGTSLRLGGAHWSTSYQYNGYLDDFRITPGVARYLTAFVPPAAPFSNTGVAGSNEATGHSIGDVKSVTNPKGQTMQFTQYDSTGRLAQVVDAKGVITDITYTARGLPATVTTTPPGLAPRTTTYSYDGLGQVIGVANPDGTAVSYSYDAAHRLIGATDAKGNSVTYTLDNVDNRIVEQLKDPSGVLQRTMRRSFDALNRVQQLQMQ